MDPTVIPTIDSTSAATIVSSGYVANSGQSVSAPPPNDTPKCSQVSGTGDSNTDIEIAVENNLPDPGDRIKQYEIIRILGVGGMGTVYLARDTQLGRRVAIKFLQTDHPELTRRFILEAKTTARAQHENIVVIYEVGEYEGQPFMVLEYLQGQALTELICEGQSLPPARVVELLIPVAKALARAHEEGIVHRDLKPDNIFVTESGTIKVLDFGIAKVLRGDVRPAEQPMVPGATGIPSNAEVGGADLSMSDAPELTKHGMILGTMAYMSPEQWGINVGIDHRSDIWAVGILMFRMLVGKHPLSPLRGEQLLVTTILDTPMPRLAEKAPHIPTAFAEVVDRCLMKHKDQRYKTASDLLRALEPLRPEQQTRELHGDESPYSGLNAFQEADADKFFGRPKEIELAIARIRQHPLMAIVGSSGCGKSSFVRAGIVPALKRSGERWDTTVIRPGRDPMHALALVAAKMHGLGDLSESSPQLPDVISRLHAEPGFLGTIMREEARRRGGNILLFIDQFEELYTLLGDPEERRAFTACLTGVADDSTTPLRVVLSLRSDFLDRVPEDPIFMSELQQGLFFLTAPNRDGLRDALTQPAQMAGYMFETPNIVEDMLNHLAAASGALPLLQFAATELWNNRDVVRKLLTEDSYNQIGGIAGALASHADNFIQQYALETQALARTIFLWLVTPERTRAIISLDELSELSTKTSKVQALVDDLVRARLLVVQNADGEGDATAEIVHESLIHSWPRLRRWLDENQEDSAFLEQLRTAAKQWEAHRYDAGLLWRGEVMAGSQRWYSRQEGELPDVQRKFLEAGFALAARSTRRRRLLLAATMTVLVGMVAASAVALVVIRAAKQSAESEAIAAQSSETLAKRSAHQATRAQRDAEAKAEELAIALDREQKLEKQAVVLDDELKLKNEALTLTNETLGETLEEAEKAKSRARREAERAEASAIRAQLQADRAVAAEERASELAAERQRQITALEKRMGKPIVSELK
ncbi:MAG: protein kinase [Myxococcales bacterium]|nr:protein kinase [Myxococcales bacterium]